MFKPNALYYVDGYKVGHKRMLAKGTVRLYGTWIPRSLKYAPKGVTKIAGANEYAAKFAISPAATINSTIQKIILLY